MAIQRQARHYKLARRNANGKSTELIEAGARVAAEASSVYSLLDADSGATISAVRVKRAGDDLQVLSGDELVVTLSGFFTLAGTGAAFEMPTLVADANGFELATGDTLITPETQVGDGASSSATDAAGANESSQKPLVGLLALGAVGAAGGGGKGGSGGSLSGPLGIMTDDAIGGAHITIHYDRNANGKVDAGEVVVSNIVSSTAASSFGQFEIPVERLNFDPSVGMLKISGSGGYLLVDGKQVPVSGALEYKAYVTDALSGAEGVTIVLSPLTTLAAYLFEDKLAQGLPDSADLNSANLAALARVAEVFGLPDAAPADLLQQAPSAWSAERAIAERQVNALCVSLLALATGSTAADGTLTAGEDALMSALAHYLDQHPGFNPADAGALRAAIVAVLPSAAEMASPLAQVLSTLMNDIALFDGHGRPASDGALAMLPPLLQTLASLHPALDAGTLDASDPALLSAFASLDASLRAASANALPAGAHAWVVADATGVFIDQNRDGRLDDSDRVDGQWVVANFAAGANANLAAKAVSVNFAAPPTSDLLATMSGLGANDALTWEAAERIAGQQTELSVNATSLQQLLDLASSRGLTVDFSVATSAPDAGMDVTVDQGSLSGRLGALRLHASGTQINSAGSDAKLAFVFDGDLTGPLDVWASGENSLARLDLSATAGINMNDVAVRASALNSEADLYVTVDDTEALSDQTVVVLGSVLCDASGTNSTAIAGISANDGSLLINGSLHARPYGNGGYAEISVSTGQGDITVKGDVAASVQGVRAGTSISLTATGGELTVAGDVLALGAGNAASVTLAAGQSAYVGTVAALASAPDMVVNPAPTTISINADAGGVHSVAVHAVSMFDQANSLVSLQGHDLARVTTNAGAWAKAANSIATVTLTADAGSAQVDNEIAVLSEAEQSVASFIMKGASSGAQPAVLVGGSTTLSASGLGDSASLTATTTAGDARFTGDLLLGATGLNSGIDFSVDSAGAVFFNRNITLASTGQASSLSFSASAALGELNIDGDLSIHSDAGSRIGADVSVKSIDVNLRAQSGNVMLSKALILTTYASGSRDFLNAEIHADTGQVQIAGGIDAQLSAYLSKLDLRVHAGGDLTLGASVILASDSPIEAASIDIGNETGKVTIVGDPIFGDAVTVTSLEGGPNNRPVLVRIHSSAGQVELQGSAHADANGVDSWVRAEIFAGAVGTTSNSDIWVNQDVNALAQGDRSAAELALNLYDSSGAVQVTGDVIVDARGVSSFAQADLHTNNAATAGSVEIIGALGATAYGVGSKAIAHAISDGGDLRIGGDLTVIAGNMGAYAFLQTQANHGTSILNGAIEVSADSGAGSLWGAVAVAQLQLAQLSAPASVDAVQGSDVSLLSLDLKSHGGAVQVGSAISAGIAYLEFTDASAASVALNFGAAQGTGVLALDLPDQDYQLASDFGAVEAAKLDVSGFRAGHDKLYAGNIDPLSVRFLSIEDGSTSFLQRFYDAVLQQQSGADVPLHYLSYAYDGANTYVAYDDDGVGITGIVELHGTAAFSVADVMFTLRSKFPVPVRPVLPTDVAVDIAPLSQTDALRTYAAMDVDAGTLEKKQPAVINNAGALTIAGDVSLTTSGEYAAMIATIHSNGSQTQAGDMIIEGNYFAMADGLESSVTSTVDAIDGVLQLSKGAFTMASGAGATAYSTLTVRNQSHVPTSAASVSGAFSAQASADYSKAQQNLFADAGAVDVQGDVLVGAGAYRSNASASIKAQAGDIHTGDLTASNSGNEATATLVVSTLNADANPAVRWSGSITTGAIDATDLAQQSNPTTGAIDATDLAQQTYPTTGAHVSVSAHDGNLTVNGGIGAHAAGRNSSASVLAESFVADSAPMADGTGAVDVNGAADVNASGQDSRASVMVRTLEGALGLHGSATVTASGIGSNAQMDLSAGRRMPNEVVLVDGSGDLLAEGSFVSSATERESTALLRAVTYAGSITIDHDAVAQAQAEHATAGIALQAGAGRADYLSLPVVWVAPAAQQVAMGRMQIRGKLNATASGYGSTAWVSATALGGDLLLDGALQLFAVGESSTAVAYVQALQGGDVHVHDIALQAAQGHSATQAIVYAQDGSITVDSTVAISATAAESSSVIRMYGGGGDASIRGDVSLSAEGRSADVALWFSSGKYGSVAGAGDTSVIGTLSVHAAGTNSFVRARVGAESDSGLSIAGDVDIAATGVGASAHVALLGGSTATRPIAIDIAGNLNMRADAEGSQVNASLLSGVGDVHIAGNVSVSASGLSSQIRDDENGGERQLMTMRAVNGDLIVDGGVALQAGGDHAGVKAALVADHGRLQIGDDLQVLASGFDSDMLFRMDGAEIVVHGDVQAKALGAGSLLAFQSGLVAAASPSEILIDGSLQLLADSGVGADYGATLNASIAIQQLAFDAGALRGVAGDLTVDARQLADHATVGLTLKDFGGTAVLGSATSAGSVAVNFVDKLASEITIGFAADAGKATIGVQLNADNEQAMSKDDVLRHIAVVTGFRADGAHDTLDFSSLRGVPTSATDYGNDADSLSKLVAAADLALDGTTQQVFAGIANGQTYIAFDGDGTGFSGMIELAGVHQLQASYITSTGAVG